MNKSTRLVSALLLALPLLATAQTAAPTRPAAPKSRPAKTTPAAQANTPAVGPVATPVAATLPRQAVPGGAPLAADHIVAIVNSEPITNNEVRARIARLPSPPDTNPTELRRQVLERLITERTQVQLATETGLQVDEASLAQAEEGVARQNGLSVAGLQERLRSLGMDPTAFRADLKRDLLLQRVREREVDNRVRVSESDIDAYIREQQDSRGPGRTELNLGQLLVKVPDNADAATLARLQALAQQLTARARAGENFASLVREFSEGPEREQGGQMGLRPADRYPTLFLEAVQDLKAGGVAGPVRSGAGFHVLKVLEKRATGLPDATYTQTRARHILLRPKAQLNQDAALARLAQLRQRVLSGQASFDALAREFSEDGSAGAGGDLGWASPGQFVPEFEQAMATLAPGQVSEPLVSRFGVHLIQVVQRRQVEMTALEQRDMVRNLLREKKAQDSYEDWARDLRARAYVEYRETPQ